MHRLDDILKELDFTELDNIIAQMDFTDLEIPSFDDLEIESFADILKKDDLEELPK